MRRSPEEIVMLMVNALKSARENDFITIVELNKKSGIHFRTLQSYASLIEYIQKTMPTILPEKTDVGLGIRIVHVPQKVRSERDDFLLYLFDKAAFKEDRSIPIPKWISKTTIMDSEKEGLIDIHDRCALLPSKGILKAAELAEQREELILRSIKQRFTIAEKNYQDERKEAIIRFLSPWKKNTGMSAECLMTDVGGTLLIEEEALTSKDAKCSTGYGVSYGQAGAS